MQRLHHVSRTARVCGFIVVVQDLRDPVSRYIRALFQFSKRAASEAAKFGRGGVEFLGMVGAARLERGEPAVEAGVLIRR